MPFLSQPLSVQFAFDKNDDGSSEPVLWSWLNFSFIYPDKHECEPTKPVGKACKVQ